MGTITFCYLREEVKRDEIFMYYKVLSDWFKFEFSYMFDLTQYK